MLKNLLKGCVGLVVLFLLIVPASAAEYTLKVGTVVSEQHVDYICMRDVFKKQVEEKSGGKIIVQIYPNAQLGGDREMIESVQLGTLEMCLPTPSCVAGFDKRFSVFESPYLFDNYEEAREALTGDFAKLMDSYLPSLGMINLGYANIGFRQMMNSKRPIYTPEDVKGLKMRVMEVPVMIDYMQELGANPSPLSYSELYTALQLKTVDGNDQPYCIAYDGKFFEVQKYISETNHFFTSELLITSKAFLEKLPDELRQIVVDAAREYCDVQWDMIVKQNEKDRQRILEAGVEINSLTSEQIAVFKKMADPVYEKYKDIYGEDIMEFVHKFRQ